MDKFTQIYAMLMKKTNMNIAKNKKLVKEDQDTAFIQNMQNAVDADPSIDGAEPSNSETPNEFPGFVFDGGNKQYVKEFEFTDDNGATTSFKLVAVTQDSGPNAVDGAEGTAVSISLSDSDDPIMEAFSNVSGSRQEQLKNAIENLCGKFAKLQNSIRTAVEMTGAENGLLTEADGLPSDESSVDKCDDKCDGKGCDCGKPKPEKRVGCDPEENGKKKAFGGTVIKRRIHKR